MTPPRASNMGGGGSYEPYGDSPYGPINPKKHSMRRGQKGSLDHRQFPETMNPDLDADYMANASTHHKHRPAQTSSTSNKKPHLPRGLNSPYMVDRIYNWSLCTHDRNHGTDLATLRKKRAALEAKLQARGREGRPYDETDGENAQAIVHLFEIERDIARLEKSEGGNGGGEVCDDGRGGEERMGSSRDFDQNRSRAGAGGRVRQDTRGRRGSSELPKRSSNNQAAVRQAGMRHPDSSGHTSRRHEMTEEDDIAPITRDFSRLGVEPRSERGNMARSPRHYDEASGGHRGSSELPKRSTNQAGGRQVGRRHPDGPRYASRHEVTEDDITRDFSRLGIRSRENSKTPRPPCQHPFPDYADETSAYHQPRGSLKSRHQPSAGHGLSSSGRFFDHELGAPSRRQNDATGESAYQPRRSPHGRHQPSAGHARSSAHYPDHESGAPSRHQNAEDYAAGEFADYPPRRSRHGRHHQPSATGHGGSSSGRFAADHYSSR